MRLDERSASCLIYTFKEGMLSVVAHDLKIRVERFVIEVPGLETGAPSALRATFDATSLRVHCAMHDRVERPGALSPGDRRKIERVMADSVLQTRRWPEVSYEATEPAAVGAWLERETRSVTLAGRLRLCGVERALDVEIKREARGYVSEIELHQPDFGIKPFTAALGMLRIRPNIRVRLEIPHASVVVASPPSP